MLKRYDVTRAEQQDVAEQQRKIEEVKVTTEVCQVQGQNAFWFEKGGVEHPTKFGTRWIEGAQGQKLTEQFGNNGGKSIVMENQDDEGSQKEREGEQNFCKGKIGPKKGVGLGKRILTNPILVDLIENKQ